MPAKIDFSSVFRNALPMAYIRNVSLLEGELTEERISVRDRDEPILVKKNKFGKTKVSSGRSRRTKAKRLDRGLTINVDLVLKDGFTKTGEGSWYDDELSRKHLKLRVWLCRDKKASEKIINGTITLKQRNKFFNSGDIIEEIIDLDNLVDTPLRRHRRERVGKKQIFSIPYSTSFSIEDYQPDYLSVFAATFLETGQFSVQKRSYNSRSRSIVQGNMSGEILIANGKIKNNAYFFRTPAREIWAGPTHFHENKKQDTIKKGQKPDTIKKGQKPDVPATRGSYMAGAFHTSRRHSTLKIEEVHNIIVSDWRAIKLAEEAQLYLFPDVPEKIGSVGRKRSKTSENLKVPRRKSYVSELFDSSNPSNVRNFIFNLDFEQLIRFEGQYGKLLEVADKRARRRIMTKSRIRNMRVFRHRVVPGLHKNTVKDASFGQRTELIAMASALPSGAIPRSTRESHPDATTTDADPKSIGAIKEINVTAVPDLRTFSVSDYDMSRRTDGLYQYSVDFEIEDGTIDFAREQLNKLVNARIKLQQFYNLSTRYSNYDANADRATTKFEREMKEKYPVPRRMDVMTGRKIDRSKLISQGISSAPWIRSAAVYVDVLFNLTDISDASAGSLTGLLYEISNPYCGRPTGTLTVLSMMESLEAKIKKVLGRKIPSIDELDYAYSAGSSVRGSAVASSKGSRPSIQLNKRFKKVFDSDILKNVGYDFLGGRRRKGVGVRQLSLEDFRSRVLQENEKHFKPGAAAGTGKGTKASRIVDTRPSYLSVSRIDTGVGKSFPIGRRPFSPLLCRRASSAILALKPAAAGTGKDRLNPNPGFGRTWSPDKNQDITKRQLAQNEIDSVTLAQLGITLMDSDEYSKRRSFERERSDNTKKRNKKVEASALFGASTKLVTDAIEDEDKMTTRHRALRLQERVDLSPIASAVLSNFARSDKHIFSEPKVRTIEQFDLDKNPHSIVDRFLKIRKDKTLKDVMNKMPNQVRSIFMSKDPLTKNKWFAEKRENNIDVFADPRRQAMIYFHYQMLNRIEVFKGFKKSLSTGELMMQEPRFVLLTEEDVVRAAKEKQTLVCRMRPWNSAMLGFEHSRRLSLPIYDEHFVISPRKSRGEEGTVPEKRMFIKEISDGRGLNTRGAAALQKIVEISMLENMILPEYMATIFVQQRSNITKFGTDFGATKDEETTKSSTGVSATAALKSLSVGQNPETAPKTGPGPKKGNY